MNDPVWPGLAEYRTKNGAKESPKPPHPTKRTLYWAKSRSMGAWGIIPSGRRLKDAEKQKLAAKVFAPRTVRAAAVPHGSGRLEFFLTSGSANDELVRRRIR